jgi:hypothetical protein
MRRTKTVLAMVAVMAAMLVVFAAPAMADDNNRDDFCDNFNCNNNHDDDFCDIFDCNDNNNNDDFCDVFDCNNNNNNDDFCDIFDCRDNNNDNNFVPAVTQDFDQESESGDVDQSFDVSSTGDNSNQTVGTQGVANTGNAQNQIGVIDAGNGFGDFDNNNNNDWWNNNNRWNHNNNNDGGDFEFDDVVSTIELSPTNTTSSDQAVDQAATASD